MRPSRWDPIIAYGEQSDYDSQLGSWVAGISYVNQATWGVEKLEYV